MSRLTVQTNNFRNTTNTATLMDTAALMSQLMSLLDGVTDPAIAGEIILPVLKECAQGIPDEVLGSMAETLFMEILEERNRSNPLDRTSASEPMPEAGGETTGYAPPAESVEAAPPSDSGGVMEAAFSPESATEKPDDSTESPPAFEEIAESVFQESPPPSEPAEDEETPRNELAPPPPSSSPSPIVPVDPSPPVPVASPAVPTVIPSAVEREREVFDDRILPRWVIDWGGSLPMSGALLSPKFLILAPHFQSKPRVQMELDQRLPCPYWNRTPSLSPETEGVWSYYEQLNINVDETYTAGREYLLRVRVVFQEDEGRNVYCFQGTVRIKTPDASQTQRTLEISGDGASLINLSSADLAEFQRVRITGGDQTLVNVQRGWTPPEADKEPRHHLVEMQLKPDAMARSIVPRRSAIAVTPFRSERIILASENGEQTFFLFAKPHLLVGRSAEETLTEEACDLVTRVYHPKFEEIDYFDDDLIRSSRFLTRLFSRNHCEMEIMPRGLRISDTNSTLGTYVAGQQLDNSQVLAEWKHLQNGLSVVIGGLLELIVKTHVDPAWRRIDSLDIFRGDELEGFYTQAAFGDSLPFHAQGMSGLWKLAVDRGDCDAILISRQKQLVFERFRQTVIRRIRSRTAKAEPILAELESSLHHCKYDPFAKSREYIVLFRSATIGSSRDDAIFLPNSGLGEGVARILSIDKMFWIEPLQVDYHTIRLDGRVLQRNELCPLAPKQTLHLGERRFIVETCDPGRNV